MSANSDNESRPHINDPLNLTAEEWEFDGDGALWPKTNEPVDPELSIGIISEFRPCLSHVSSNIRSLASCESDDSSALVDIR